MILLVVLPLLATVGSLQADDIRYQYKFPCYNPADCYVTQLAHVNNALDFDPLGNAGLGGIPAMAEGVVASVNVDQTTCTASGLGIWVGVSDIHGRTTKYAHLSGFSVSVGTVVFQGDQLGTEGNTGHAENCAYHLHWEPGASPPAYIDNIAVSSLSLGNHKDDNTNSVIGEFSTMGVALRSYYRDHGRWNSIGWTHKHCPGACTLYMTNNASWGRMQDFRHHVDFLGGQFNTIHVSDWNFGQAYLVDSVFWQWWAAGGVSTGGVIRPLSMARAERGSCPAGSTTLCISYQNFHLGYVWMASNGARASAFCPDVWPPYAGDLDATAQDAQWVFAKVGQASADPFYDVDGNGAVEAGDAQLVFNNVRTCFPIF